jgi:ATP-dependent Zn protease
MKQNSESAFVTRCNAYHEAGHALAAIVHGYRVVGVDIRPVIVPGLGQTLGSAELALPLPKEFLGKGEDAVMPLLVVLLAGVFAEQRVNDQAGLDIGHAQSDGQRAMKYAAGAICKPVLRNGNLVTPGEEVQQKMPLILECVEKARLRAQEFASSHGAAIDSVAEALGKSGVLTSIEIERLIADATTN